MSVPRAVDVKAVVTSGNDVESPFTGARAAFFHVELFADGSRSLGEIVLGDLVTLRAFESGATDEPLELVVVVRRARYAHVSPPSAAVPLDEAPPEAVAVLSRSRGIGLVSFRETAVVTGTLLRVRATVEASGARLVARDELAPVLLDEVVLGA